MAGRQGARLNAAAPTLSPSHRPWHALQAAASSPTTSPPPPRQSGTLTASTAPHATFLVRHQPPPCLARSACRLAKPSAMRADLPCSALPPAPANPLSLCLRPVPSNATAQRRCAFSGVDSSRSHWYRALPGAAGHLEQEGAGPGGGGPGGNHAGRRAAHPPARLPAGCASVLTPGGEGWADFTHIRRELNVAFWPALLPSPRGGTAGTTRLPCIERTQTPQHTT